MKKENYILIAIGGVVLFLIWRLRPQTVSVPTLVPVASPNQEGATDGRDPARVAAFESLASLGQSAFAADANRDTVMAQLEAERVRSGAELDIERSRISAESAIASLGLETQERIAMGELAAQAGVESKRIDAERALGEALYQARLNEVQAQIGALNNVAFSFRNQSLERQGTILNAFTSTFGAGAPYNYVDAFGRQSQTGAQAFGSVLGGIGSAVKSFIPFL